MSGKAVLDTLGVLGVIGSLVFVGLEVRQNTAVARAAAYHSFMTEVHAQNARVATDDRLAGLLVRVYMEDAATEDFTPEEQIRLREHLLGLVRVWEGLYRSVSEGLLDEEDLRIVARGGALSNRFFRELWPAIRPQFSEGFVAFLEPQVGLR